MTLKSVEQEPIPGRNQEGEWTAFQEKDPFNGFLVSGYLNRTPKGMLYGALHITSVEGKPCDQFVWATPKQNYPYDYEETQKEQEIVFPEIAKVKVYEKLDGTNILAYRYQAPIPGGESWQDVVSYKTRLLPFMNKKYISLWKEMLVRYPDIPDIVLATGCNLSFELYGRRNQNMVLYETPLDTALLFGVRPGEPESSIVSPDELETGSLKLPKLIKTLDRGSDLKVAYHEVQAWLNSELKAEQEGNMLDIHGGLEGTVWYAYSEEGLLQYKCKPELLLDSYYIQSVAIPQHSIATTIMNAFEDREEPDYHYIASLLGEEFSKEKIAKREFIIRELLEETLERVRTERDLGEKVLALYEKSGLDFKTQKGQVLGMIARELGAGLSKQEKKKISQVAFNFLNQRFG